MKKLFIASTGPGDKNLITPQTLQAIAVSSDLVSYGLYLDLLGEMCANKFHHVLALGQEIERARLALNLAAEGKTTALLSSGDVGIYAMASVVFELLDRHLQGKESPEQSEWLNIDIEVIAGISAMQAASSRVGAILGHDFCTISLSDLLTPWQTIEQRVHSAGIGDFVIAFYNPVSRKRDWQLNAARDILLGYRPASTPVVLGRQLTRADEQITLTTLGELDAKDVDMFTLVAVGNRETRQIQYHDHHTDQAHQQDAKQIWVYTPRGYQQKL